MRKRMCEVGKDCGRGRGRGRTGKGEGELEERV
jgi:hypothetical protein